MVTVMSLTVPGFRSKVVGNLGEGQGKPWEKQGVMEI